MYKTNNTVNFWETLDAEIAVGPRLSMGGEVHLYPSEPSHWDVDPVTGSKIAVGSCLRQIYYRYKNQSISRGFTEGDLYEQAEDTATTLWKFASSLGLEKEIIEASKRAGVWAGDHVRFKIRDINLSGELDLVVIDPNINKLVVVECCLPGTLIVGNNYLLKEIESNLKEVLTHTGRYQIVNNWQERNVVNEPTFKIRSKFDGLVSPMTGEHPVLIGSVKEQRLVANNKKRTYSITSTQWKPIKEVKAGDYYGIPKVEFSYKKDDYIFRDLVSQNTWLYTDDGNFIKGGSTSKLFPSKVNLSEDLYWLLGLYIAEGSCSNSAVYFSLNSNETGYIDRITSIVKNNFNLDTVVYKFKNAQCVNVRICSTAFRHWIKTFVPGNSVEKTKHVRFDLLSNKYLPALLQGIFDGDGTNDKYFKRIVTSVPNLSYFYFHLAAQCGLEPTLHKYQQQSYFKSDHIYAVEYSNGPKGNRGRLVETEDCYFYKVKSVDKDIYTGTVYNMEVSVDNSYTNGGIAVHNCKSIYGYNSESNILGTASSQRKGFKGSPLDKNEMQLALYVWFWKYKVADPKVAYGKLVYISRGSGQRCEFTYDVEPDGQDWIIYRDGQKLSYTINDIVDRYVLEQEYIDNNELPPRDYDLQYSNDYIKLLAEQDLLSKTDQEKYDKAIAKGKVPKIQKGDYHCGWCRFKDNCFGTGGIPINDNILANWTIVVESLESINVFNSSNGMMEFLSTLDQTLHIVVIKDNDSYYDGTIDKLERPYRYVRA